MRKFGIVHSRYWSWALENELDDFSKVLGSYFLSCDHGNSIGCFKCSVAYVSDDLGNPLQGVRKGFANLSETHFLLFCEISKYVFLPKYLKWNPLQNINQVKGALKIIETLPSSFTNTYNVLKNIKKFTNEKYFNPDNLLHFETLMEPLANPLQTPCKPIRTIDTDIDIDIDIDILKKNKQKKSFKKYLQEKIIENNMIENKDKIFEFYRYRMDMVKAKRYKTKKGIDGLISDLNKCRDAGMIIFECIEKALQKEWMTPDPSYFKKNGNNFSPMSREEHNKNECNKFVYGDNFE